MNALQQIEVENMDHEFGGGQLISKIGGFANKVKGSGIFKNLGNKIGSMGQGGSQGSQTGSNTYNYYGANPNAVNRSKSNNNSTILIVVSAIAVAVIVFTVLNVKK